MGMDASAPRRGRAGRRAPAAGRAWRAALPAAICFLLAAPPPAAGGDAGVRLPEVGAAGGPLESVYGKFLVVRCGEAGPEAWVRWGHFGALGYSRSAGSDADVTLRFDSGPRETRVWRRSPDRNMTLASRPGEFARRAARHRTLTVRGPAVVGGQLIAAFDLAAARPALREIVGVCANGENTPE